MCLLSIPLSSLIGTFNRLIERKEFIKMIEGINCSDVILKVRQIGKWKDVSTNNLFKKKELYYFLYLGLLHQCVQKNSFLDLKKIMKNYAAWE